MLKMRRPSPAARNGNEGPTARLSSALLCMRGVLPAPAKRRAVRAASGPIVLPPGLREGDVSDAAGQFGRRRHAGREQQTEGWEAGTEKTQDDLDVGTKTAIQGVL